VLRTLKGGENKKKRGFFFAEGEYKAIENLLRERKKDSPSCRRGWGGNGK